MVGAYLGDNNECKLGVVCLRTRFWLKRQTATQLGWRQRPSEPRYRRQKRAKAHPASRDNLSSPHQMHQPYGVAGGFTTRSGVGIRQLRGVYVRVNACSSCRTRAHKGDGWAWPIRENLSGHRGLVLQRKCYLRSPLPRPPPRPPRPPPLNPDMVEQGSLAFLGERDGGSRQLCVCLLPLGSDRG